LPFLGHTTVIEIQVLGDKEINRFMHIIIQPLLLVARNSELRTKKQGGFFMNAVGFLKGVGIGMVVGAAVTMAVAPMDKRKMRHSAPGRTLHAIGQVLENLT